MEQTNKLISSSSSMGEDIEKEASELYVYLPKVREGTPLELSLWQGVWFPTKVAPFQGFLSFQRFFEAHDQDIVLASAPKCGTTWLKSLLFSIVNRSRFTPSNSPLLTTNPHVLVPHADSLFHSIPNPDLTTIPSPRLFHTHFPYSTLPESMKNSDCLIVYICRNPFDSALSLWHHYHGLQNDFQMPVEEFFELYFEGISGFGPYWDNVLGYWKESLDKPNKVLFLKYEDLKEDTISSLKTIAKFIKYPFSEEEERENIVEEIIKLCSLKTLQNLEVNKSDTCVYNTPNRTFFRKGNVGEGIALLSPSVKQKLLNMMEEKFSGSGLSFKLSI